MSVRFDASADYLTRGANTPSGNSFTMAGWCYRVSAPATEQILFWLGSVRRSEFIDATTLGIYDGNGWSTGFSGIPTTATWFYFAITSNGTDLKGWWTYQSPVSWVTLTDSTIVSDATNPDLWIGGIGAATFFDGRVAHLRIWDTVLTQTELETELASATLVKTANINGAYPLASNTTDVSGNGRNWTEFGTLTYEADPTLGTSRNPVSMGFVLE